MYYNAGEEGDDVGMVSKPVIAGSGHRNAAPAQHLVHGNDTRCGRETEQGSQIPAVCKSTKCPERVVTTIEVRAETFPIENPLVCKTDLE
jgi:hypothetical protein